jgi:hypothetical protein
MKALEIIREDLQPYPVRESLIRRYCAKHSISPDEENPDEGKISLCVVEILSQMKSLNNVSEGGVSISFNEDNVNAIIRRKCAELGIDDTPYLDEPTVQRIE